MSHKSSPKRFYLRTYGCQMNFHDSERMHGILEGMGLESVSNASDADIVLINTCAVREKPERKLFAELGRLRKVKQQHPDTIIGVSGCMAPRDADVIRKQAPFVDMLIGPRSIHRLPELIDKVNVERMNHDSISICDDPTPLTPVKRSSMVCAWVDVMFGCDYACTYCAVPTARGPEISQLPNQIFDEIDELTMLGYGDVTLLGQTVNAYGRDFHYNVPESQGGEEGKRQDFSWLLEKIVRRAPNMRIRFTSPHPQLFNDRLIRSIADLPGVCEHVHLPLQSADDTILRRMKRSYTYRGFQQIVYKLRDAVPDIAITTDIIVGFPGETEQQFEKTLRAFDELQFDQAFMFIYSPRRHTEALDFSDLVPVETQKRRLQHLIALANDQFNRKNRLLVGKSFEVLVEGPSDKNPDRLCGRTRTNKMVIFNGSADMVGNLTNVRSEKAFMWGFTGEIISESK